jgi:two-component system, OmpR family, response regulator
MAFGPRAVYNGSLFEIAFGILKSKHLNFINGRLELSPMQPTKCRILCVDDHEDTSFMLKHLLGGSAYEVVTANGLDAALRLGKSEDFDLYVLDKRLPDGSGLDLCRKLSAITPQVPIIFYSGDAYDLHRQEGLCAGAEAYVSKPHVDELIETVRRLLADRECAAAIS